MLLSRRLCRILCAAIVAQSWLSSSYAADAASKNGKPGAAPAAQALPFNVTVHGSFKHMQHKGDYTPKARLADVLSVKDIYAVGALSGRRGEITIIGGKPYISLGGPTSSSLLDDGMNKEEAALLVTAGEIEWKELDVPNDMSQVEFEAFVTDSARAAGLDMSRPFPFMLKGEISNYKIHVLAPRGPNDSAGGHGAVGGQYNATGDAIQGRLLGFYSSAGLSGVISHPGELFHIHLVDAAETISAHMDGYGVRKHSTLLIPKP
ncbi:MAG: hypothetical protein WA191_19780 [Telluria sp.]|nr:hypothetical protein [Telluria sp.]